MGLYLRGVSSAYFLLLVNIAYSFTSIPIIIHFLGSEVFGLWAIALQIGVVLQLADLGLCGALVRILINHKDDKVSPGYQRALFSVWTTLCVIAVVVISVVSVLIPHLVSILEINLAIQPDFAEFLLFYLVVFSLKFVLNPISLALASHQRADLTNWTSSFGFLVALIALVFFLNGGSGLWSLVYAQLIVVLVTHAINFWQAVHLGFIPSPKLGDLFHLKSLLEIASYGWQRLLAILGTTLLSSAPTFLITRYLGLEATAAWTVGTRVQRIFVQLMSKLPELAFPSLVEMQVRGEKDLMKQRFLEVLRVTSAGSCVLAGLLLACNREFVVLWAGRGLSWGFETDIAIALLFLVMISQKIFWYPASIAKDLGITKYSFLLEAGLFSLIVVLTPRNCLSLFFFASIMASTGMLVSLPILIWRTAQILKMSFLETIKQGFTVVLRGGIPILIISFLLTKVIASEGWIHLIIDVVLISMMGFLAVISVSSVRGPVVEILNRVSAKDQNGKESDDYQ